MGTLPSNYLKWVSKNLRARDFEEWAKLADQVLNDPVYKDRIEWEFARKVLNGDVLSSKTVQDSAVSDLVEISERFGWDNEDKVGWAKVDFGLLGTSKGGRIPRVSVSESGPRPEMADGLEIMKPNVGDNVPLVQWRRKERRERVKLKRENNGERFGIKDNDKGIFGNSSNIKLEGIQEQIDEHRVVEIETKKSAFPGREGLLKKVLNRRKL
ncbi:hypothetical protein ACH5RR_032732 [Cinchona calisaya]|uniref:Uncharacterized protein n=1 Tax=Cinchona calisaya TaxID=153742 RepID=A0ABD2YIY5_9GENT